MTWIFKIILFPVYLLFLLKRRLGKGDIIRPDLPMISIVGFLSEPFNLHRDYIIQRLGKLFQTNFDSTDPDSGAAVLAHDDVYFVHYKDMTFVVNTKDEPYFDEPEAIGESIKELRVGKMVAEHRAWFSVDWIYDPPEADHQEMYRHIGKMLVALAPGPEKTVGICHPDSNRVNIYNRESAQILFGNDPLNAFTEMFNAPMVRVSSDNRAMKKAVEEARGRWPEFAAAFEQRRPAQSFAAKFPFEAEPDHSEFIWIEVDGIDGQSVTGSIANDPIYVKNLKRGDFVTCDLANLNDWMIAEGDDEMRGGFTVKVLMKAQKK